ncbi:alpha-ketoglutarate-dependent dioxygenase AlkB [Alteromonas pelagimontana]|uniref:Alpha-ketoglutarate-dependent dioxygenase AlkB n=1 Tax=Alteromonas pelagimontana TaxID=1858656 RepID=A0A6M4MB25_9ALTE|nr:alpha-ketoglutarate-dependent dioxygenase AlkB [Alteromonas pelagimontana]QJR80363.1 alpha-ketoglutarate-dependent dioxygenase AlkB [Alteromonas pelagimontana]
MQLNLFLPQADTASQPTFLPLPDAEVAYYSNWIKASEADQLRQQLEAELPWRQDTIKLFGKAVKIPRLQSWHGEESCVYTYSGLTMRPHPWHPVLLMLKKRCSKVTHTPFNSALANWYRHGQDSMGMHADDEPELGTEPTIASVSLGHARPFIFKHRYSGEKYVKLLEHGSLLIMAGKTQQYYTHGIAKTAKPIDGRINLTFRYINSREAEK